MTRESKLMPQVIGDIVITVIFQTGTNAKTKQKGCVTSPLEDWTDEATIAWKKTYFDNVKKRKKAKVNHFACCTGQESSPLIRWSQKSSDFKEYPCKRRLF